MNIVGREFNLLTPETEMKFDLIEAQRGQLNFVPADQIMTFAAANAMAVRGHTLVWHKSLPDWLAQGKFSRDEMITILHDYITSVVGHFKGKIAAWDVVNEAVYDDGRLRKGVWLDRIGPDYAEMAFRWAHEADPGALLFYNDYGMEELNTKSNAVYKLVKGWRAKGVPIDGVGLQMHIRADAAPRPGSMQANMERFGALGLAVQITEMDVSTSYLRGTPESRLQKQAQTVQTIANTCLSVKPCSALVVWGVTDKYTWLHSFLGPGDKPLLFDDTYQPKPAYDALLAALVGEP
jgi:endo-1,4-beta-xylanase